MTTEYLRGEVMLLLEWAQRVAPCGREPRQVMAALGREAQSGPVDDLSWVLERALPAVEAWCLDALTAGDAAAFRCRCQVAAAFYDFGICSGLLACRSGESPGASSTIWRKGAQP
jgi:hypothetical protein